MKYVEATFTEITIKKIETPGYYLTEDGTKFNTKIAAEFYESFYALKTKWNLRDISKETVSFFEGLYNLPVRADSERGFCYLVHIPSEHKTSEFCIAFNELFTYFRNNVKYGFYDYIIYYTEGDVGVRDCLLISVNEFREKIKESIRFLDKDGLLDE